MHKAFVAIAAAAAATYAVFNLREKWQDELIASAQFPVRPDGEPLAKIELPVPEEQKVVVDPPVWVADVIKVTPTQDVVIDLPAQTVDPFERIIEVRQPEPEVVQEIVEMAELDLTKPHEYDVDFDSDTLNLQGVEHNDVEIPFPDVEKDVRASEHHEASTTAQADSDSPVEEVRQAPDRGFAHFNDAWNTLVANQMTIEFDQLGYSIEDRLISVNNAQNKRKKGYYAVSDADGRKVILHITRRAIRAIWQSAANSEAIAWSSSIEVEDLFEEYLTHADVVSFIDGTYLSSI